MSGEEDAGGQGQAPEDETPADAGQAQVPQLPPPSAHLLSEFPGIVTKLQVVSVTSESGQGGPGMSSPDMAAWRALTDLKVRNLHLNIPNTCYRYKITTKLHFY